jgi:hypothetical protein
LGSDNAWSGDDEPINPHGNYSELASKIVDDISDEVALDSKAGFARALTFANKSATIA